MATIHDRLDQWLRDAHAMEKQAEQMLSAQAQRIENYPELNARISDHLSETKSQRERLEQCLERRGTSPSTAKDFAGQFTALMQGVGGMPAGDEVVKGIMASYAFEHMEMAAYRILTAAAEEAGETEIARVCEEICQEEESMAAWLADRMSDVTQTFLQRESGSGEGAKR